MFCPLLQNCRSAGLHLTRRFLSLQEYQSMQLLAENDCTVQPFFVVDSLQNAEQEFAKHSRPIYLNLLFSRLDFEGYVVKSQLLAGGRGKGSFIGGPDNFGGVQITKE
jgi:succinyl-CoA synthetase beta subunit